MDPGHAAPGPAVGRVVLLTGPGDTTDIVANYLAVRVPDLQVIQEDPPSRVGLARRRAARIGWPTVVGQIAFVTCALPLLRWRGRERIARISADAGMDATPYVGKHHVPSVNDHSTMELLERMRPSVVVVNGTRIISSTVLEGIDCPVINTHAGYTPRYRGVHGGYWALAEGNPQLVGTTVHLVDPGIDTGGILARTTFTPSSDDSIATYPYLHLAAGLPLVASSVELVLSGGTLRPLEDDPTIESRLYLHPTLWSYLRCRISRGVR